MPWRPCKRRDFVARLRRLGFEGPFPGTRHQFMTLAGHRLAIPSNEEYSIPQLRWMVREVESLVGRRLTADDRDQLA